VVTRPAKDDSAYMVTKMQRAAALVQCERYRRGGQQSRPPSYRLALFTAAALVTVTGHLGASLIYGWDYLVK